MATSPRKQTVSKKLRLDRSYKEDNPLVIDEYADSNSENEQNNMKEKNNSTNFLDMLAEVASATLENDPSISRSSPTISSKKTPSSTLVLKLDQICVLSDKNLLNMFSELRADEIRRNYTYICYLIPDKCKVTHTSFGNENRARLQMKAHLISHITELLAETNNRSQRMKFTAEPIQARKKRLSAEFKSKNKCPKKEVIKKPKSNNVKKVKEDRKTNLTKIRDKKSDKRDDIVERLLDFSPKINSNGIEDTKITNLPLKTTRRCRQLNENVKNKNADIVVKKKIQKVRTAKNIDSEKGKSSNRKKLNESPLSPPLSPLPHLPEVLSRSSSPTSKERLKDVITIKEDPVITDIPSLIDMPFHDHCYTYVIGKKPGIENFHFIHPDDQEDLLEHIKKEPQTSRSCINNSDNSNNTMSSSNNQDSSCVLVSTPSIPLLQIILPILGVQVGQTVEVKSCGYMSAQSMFDPTRRHKKNKVIIPEELEPISDLDEDFDIGDIDDDFMDRDEAKSKAESIKLKNVEIGSPEWERKLALKCIYMLRSKKKDERVPLVCRICCDKTFTALATLMYHYRSHAGIKPFVCNICNTTFTRQHSLNYHMLIHNNQSRFTCMDCGRRFRHPSHFKEHLRRHTGETPFECTDCDLKFKTRNTYKRHLKTRHGKLLSASGITVMSKEEFLKVKTNPKKKLKKLYEEQE